MLMGRRITSPLKATPKCPKYWDANKKKRRMIMENIIKSFIKEHNMLKNVPIVRGLYIRSNTTEIFVLECEEWKNQRRTLVFEFDCGIFYSCKTETNTMERYLMDICNVDRAEYVSHI